MNAFKNKFSVEDQSIDTTDTNNGVTIDEGDGKKDLIVMTGPLSQVFTKALGVYFAKTPIEDSKDDGGEIAVETQAIDAAVQEIITQASANSNLFHNAHSRLMLANQFDNYNDEPDTNVYIVPEEQAINLDVCEEVKTIRSMDEKSNRETVLFIHDFDDQTLEKEYKPVDIENTSNQNETNCVVKQEVPVDQVEYNETFSIESLYGNIKGLTIVKGVKGFGLWVQNKIKK